MPERDYNPDHAADRPLHPLAADPRTDAPEASNLHPLFDQLLAGFRVPLPRPSGDATGPHALDTEFDADPHAGETDDCATEGLTRFDDLAEGWLS